MAKIKTHRDLDAYRLAFDAAMKIFKLSKGFPKEETYSLTDQIRRSSRSVCANLAESWRRRRYQADFVNKLSIAEAAETQVWLEFAVQSEYLEDKTARELYSDYNHVIGKLVKMIRQPEHWIIGK